MLVSGRVVFLEGKNSSVVIPLNFGPSPEFPVLGHGQKSRFVGDGRPPTFNDGNPYFMGPYKPLRDLG